MYLHATRLLLGILLAAAVHPSVATVKTAMRVDKGSTGSTKRILCTVEKEGFLGWKLPNGKLITSMNKNDRPHVEKEGTKYTLVLVGITSKDGGLYVCTGSKNTASFLLQVQFKIDKSDIRDQSLVLNKKGVIKLGVSGFPKPTFKWEKDGSPITLSGHFQIQEDGSLKIKKVEINDKGKYKCTVSQFKGTDSDTADVNVEVYDPAKITQRPTAKLRPTKGFNVTMKCVASGYPKPTYDWKNRGGSKITSSGRFHVKEGELTILGVLPTDKGTYTCEAFSGYGAKANATSTIVEVYVVPIIVLSPQSSKIVTALKESQTIVCTARGTAPVRVSWVRDGVPDDRQKKSDGKSVLSLKSVRLSDVGTYTCEARNDARDANENFIVVKESVDLHIRSKPKINEKASPSVVYSFVGNNKAVDIRCLFYGYPRPTVKIFGKKNNRVAYGTGEATYKLITKKAEMFTTYRCYASNLYGNVNHTVKVDRAKPPSKVLALTTADVTCNVITIKWQEPDVDGGMPVVQYVIQYAEDSNNVDAPNTQYRAIQLKSESDHTFTVWPRNPAHRGPPEKITIKTKKFCKPSRPVILEPLSEILEDTAFTLKWGPPEEDGGDPKITYEVRYVPVVSKDKSVEKKKLPRTSKLEMTLINLKLGTTYSVEVVAINDGGESDPATRTYQVPSVSARSRSRATSASILFTIFAVGLSLVMKGIRN